MSLYNALFGFNPMAGMLLKALDITTEQVPRFRDCYLDTEGKEPRIVIYTRTGGGNRDFYEHEEVCRNNYPEYFGEADEPSGPWNSDLRKIDGFIYDADDNFDSTYASFYYSIPDPFKKIINTLQSLNSKTEKPHDKFERLIKDLEAEREAPETQRALEVAKPLFEQIKEQMS